MARRAREESRRTLELLDSRISEVFYGDKNGEHSTRIVLAGPLKWLVRDRP